MGSILSYNDFLKSYKTRGYRLRHLENQKNLFPLQASPLLAGIVADIIGDGHLQGNPKWRLDFTSKNLSDLDYFNKRINSLFGINGKIRKCNSNKFSQSFNLGVNSAIAARVLSKVGVPEGEKVMKNFCIPSWIQEDKECFREFCKELFTCEGSIMCEKKRKIPQIRLEQWKAENILKQNNFIEDLRKNLRTYFNIETTVTFPKARCIRKDSTVTAPARIYILSSNVFLFYKEVGFSNDKQKSLKALLQDNY